MHLRILCSKHIHNLRLLLRGVFIIDAETQDQLMKSTSWADGLRGLATIGVVSSHLTLCFARSLLPPCCSADGVNPTLFQRPILRLVASGHSWVAVFLLLMGFVNSLKPLKLALAFQHDESLKNLANSSLRRVFRLVLPATLTTSIGWFLCQLSLMERARNSNAWWLYVNTPAPSLSVLTSFRDLSNAIRRTWLYHNGDNIYNQPQWTMMPLLHGSIVLLLGLLFTINLTPQFRNIVLALAAVWSINLSGLISEPLVGFTTLTGILLANVSLNPTLPTLIHKKSTPYLVTIPILLGLTLMSYPSSTPDASSWSKPLSTLAKQILPYQSTIDTYRFHGSIGAVLLILGILLSPIARNILSSKPLTYLGRISFPVFLLHPLFMQTIMPYFAFSSGTIEFSSDPATYDNQGKVQMIQRHPQRGPLMIYLAILISMSACLVTSHYWMLHVEPVFGRITSKCEMYMTGKMGTEGLRDRKSALPVSDGGLGISGIQDGRGLRAGNPVLTSLDERGASWTPPLSPDQEKERERERDRIRRIV